MNQTELSSTHPPAPQTTAELEEALTRPTPQLAQLFSELDGDLLILGVGGKMGPTLAGLAKRASDEAGARRRVIGVSRFTDGRVRERLEDWGVETIACDLLDEAAVADLPTAPLVIYMVGFKFGAGAAAAKTWAMNCYAPAVASRRFSDSRIVSFSTGNVYGMVPVDCLGSRETDPLRPTGEYAMSTMGRERVFEYFSREFNISLAQLRLNYATELRYGVLLDIALLRKVKWLEPGEAVTKEELEKAEKAQGLQLGEGDILLFRTGHHRRRLELGPWNNEYGGEGKAGLHVDTIPWMHERKIAVFLPDGDGETVPCNVEGMAYPIHALQVAAMGMVCADSLQFEELVKVCEEEKRWEFMVVANPLRLPGGTGTLFNPIAIF